MSTSVNVEIDKVIAGFYAAFDNRGARVPASADIKRAFAPDGHVVRRSSDGMECWTVDEFHAPRIQLLTSGALAEFHEWETEGVTTVCGNIAQRLSRYEKAGVMHGRPYTGRGCKLIQLCRVDVQWLITSVLWEDF